ncbi:response regulator [Phenylobacterium sp.]|uniref:response regulator n=1 Tax=Phenylobacterium sp. TaxID=1871053 RepID=UPI00391CC5C4
MLSSSTRLDLRKAKVLLVDDNPQSLELMTQVLMGFRVGRITACRSAEEARESASAVPYDLLIIDDEMPEEDGISLTRHIRRQPEGPNFTAPIVMVSGNTPLEKVITARDAGANMIVKKPIAPGVLLSRIEWLARNNRQFVTTESYCGPDRRIKQQLLPEGIPERRSSAIALVSNPVRAMSQDEVDSLFG